MNYKTLASAVAFTALAVACQPAPTATTETSMTETATTTAPAEVGTIVAVAQGAGSFSTLVAALQAADLVATLEGPGPFTVFAPTDAAFAALPAGTVEDLLKPENKAKLAKILTYHVVPGETMSSALSGKADVATVNGAKLTIDASMAGTVKAGAATVTQADVDASNGVIHVIDTVLMPPA